MNTPSKQHKGFTLVELLVVISIIALLLAILMPSLQKARESGKAVVCRSNLKQMGMASNLYSMDYSDTMLSSDSYAIIAPDKLGNRHDYPWYLTMMPYIGRETPASGQVVKWKKGAIQIFKCPSQIDEFNIDSSGVLYGINTQCSSIYQQGGTRVVIKRSAIRIPASRMYVADTMDRSKPLKPIYSKYMFRLLTDGNLKTDWLWARGIYGGVYDIPVSDRHNGGSSVLFVDGHSEWMKFSDIMPEPQERTKNPLGWQKKIRLWYYEMKLP